MPLPNKHFNRGKFMDKPLVALKEVDGAEIISLMDNSLDVLSTIEKAEVRQVRDWIRERKGEKWVKAHFRLPIAEHGLSFLIRVFQGRNAYTVLFDTGRSPEGVITNAERMGIELSEIEAVVISHGHDDHFGGLLAVSKAVNKEDLPIIVHEDMFKTRGTAQKDGTIKKEPPFPSEDRVKPAKYVKTKKPYLIADSSVLVTGEIPSKTDFEKGSQRNRVLVGGEWRPYPWMWDDRAVAINIKNKGLVVLSGCAHAGIINTIKHVQHATGIKKVHGVMGGFHLAGKEYEPRISQTVENLKSIKPYLIAPSHCTGWRGIFAIAKAMPNAFVWNSVGNLYNF
jgi:7,8-dihydropterin-6-yl-methyl-4-(beta-D-ribofuranosyl)aminobenzene 5'-phosphate synthase